LSTIRQQSTSQFDMPNFRLGPVTHL